MKNYFFSSDYHFFHTNIIKYENRPFENVEDMNNTIVRRHNERVKDDDIVFFLGDLGFYASKTAQVRGEGMPINPHSLLSQMKGEKYMVCGNHDTHSNKSYIPVFSIVLKIAGANIQLIHNPDHANLNNDLIICGHVHGKWATREELNNDNIPILIINVSVEQKNYYPFTFDELKSIWDKWIAKHPRNQEIRSYMKKKLSERKIKPLGDKIE